MLIFHKAMQNKPIVKYCISFYAMFDLIPKILRKKSEFQVNTMCNLSLSFRHITPKNV